MEERSVWILDLFIYSVFSLPAQVNVKGSVTMLEPAYKPPMAPNSVCAPASTSDTSVSWTNVCSAERESAWRHLQARLPAGRRTVERWTWNIPVGMFIIKRVRHQSKETDFWLWMRREFPSHLTFTPQSDKQSTINRMDCQKECAVREPKKPEIWNFDIENALMAAVPRAHQRILHQNIGKIA